MARNVFVTRLHVRYDADHFPEDLIFQETGDRSNFQGRYVLRHAWNGEATCEAAKEYKIRVKARMESEAKKLASLTGWDIDKIRDKMDLDNMVDIDSFFMLKPPLVLLTGCFVLFSIHIFVL